MDHHKVSPKSRSDSLTSKSSQITHEGKASQTFIVDVEEKEDDEVSSRSSSRNAKV